MIHSLLLEEGSRRWRALRTRFSIASDTCARRDDRISNPHMGVAATEENDDSVLKAIAEEGLRDQARLIIVFLEAYINSAATQLQSLCKDI